MFGRIILLLGAVLTVGCAEPLQLLARAPTSGVSPCSFWPPEPSSATWVAESKAEPQAPMSSVAASLELGLRAAGYSNQRWFPIGTRHEHGFAVTTRLERVDGAERSTDHERWTSLYREAATLKWLRLVRTLPMLQSGRYRVLLIAYTDLPIGPTSVAPTWSEETMMDGPGASDSFSAGESGVPARLPSGYQFGIYEYEYQREDSALHAALRAAPPPAAEEMRRPPARFVRILAAGLGRQDKAPF
jgi:hypothetical protein